LKVNYDDYTRLVTIGSEEIDIEELLGALPTEKARVETILWRIDAIRKEKIENLGSFQDIIIELVKKESAYRQKLDDLMHLDTEKILAIRNNDKMRASYIKAYGELIKACLTEKNTLTEYRHAQKFLTNEEARFMVLLAKLE